MSCVSLGSSALWLAVGTQPGGRALHPCARTEASWKITQFAPMEGEEGVHWEMELCMPAGWREGVAED